MRKQTQDEDLSRKGVSNAREKSEETVKKEHKYNDTEARHILQKARERLRPELEVEENKVLCEAADKLLDSIIELNGCSGFKIQIENDLPLVSRFVTVWLSKMELPKVAI